MDGAGTIEVRGLFVVAKVRVGAWETQEPTQIKWCCRASVSGFQSHVEAALKEVVGVGRGGLRPAVDRQTLLRYIIGL